jgi:hypothetical protein
MSIKEKSMVRRLLIVLTLLAASSAVMAGEAGKIVFVSGQAQASGRNIALGDTIQEGEELNTGSDGYIYLKTTDNGFLILRPGTRARVVAYHIDEQNPANNRVKFELHSGVARAISGKGVKQSRQNFRFNTPVAAIGVRGTDFTVFTDQQTSRIAVVSGGVVVSGFSGSCGPEGGGPCEGGSSRELFADQKGQLLQIQKGQPVPQVLRGSAMSPDAVVPPRSDEPASTSSSKSGAANATAASDVNLDVRKNKDILANAKLPAPPAPLPTPPEPPVSMPVEPLPPVVVPKAPEVMWGRWQAVADLPANSEQLAKLRNGQYAPATIVNSFFISRVTNTDFVMPQEGKAGFNLVGSEAYIRAGSDKLPVAATVRDAKLDVDFGRSAFATSMSVVGAGTQVDIRAQGDVTSKGELVSDVIRSNATVRGYLGGATAQEAGYIFNSSPNTSGATAFGGTRWTR